MALLFRALFLLVLIFCCIEVGVTAASGGTLSGKILRKKLATAGVAESSAVIKPVQTDSPASSSSKRWPTTSSAGNDDEDEESIPLPLEPVKLNTPEHSLGDLTVPFESATHEKYPLDLLARGDPQYLKYLKSKTSPKSSSRSPTSSNSSRKRSNQVENFLKLQGCSMWNAIKIIESPDFHGTEMEYLNDLPLIYLKRRVMELFKAFLRRFKYQNEFNHLFNQAAGKSEDSYTTPFTILVMKFLDPAHLSDTLLDPFFIAIVESQSEAFEPLELFFFDLWLKNGPSTWRFIKYYFDFSQSVTKSDRLIRILIDKNYSGPVTRDLIVFLIAIESFDINTKIPYAFSGETLEVQLTPFFHILVYERQFSTSVLPVILRDPRLDANVPTGKITLTTDAFKLTYTDLPIIYLATVMSNLWALVHLFFNDKIAAQFKGHKFIFFVICHVFKALWLTLLYKLRKYHEIISSSILKYAK